MNLETLRTKYKDAILALAAEHHADNVRVFGSVVRNEADDDSDVDFLMHFGPEASYMDLAALDWKIAELIGRKADVVADRSLKEWYKEQILNEAKPL